MKGSDYVIFIFGVIILSSVLKNNNKENDSFSLETMTCVKGIFAIMIVLFHLSQHIEGGYLFRVIGDTGYLSVAIFFFISGYGMYKRVIQTGGGTAKALLQKEFQE